jgi:hypothetical protein
MSKLWSKVTASPVRGPHWFRVRLARRSRSAAILVATLAMAVAGTAGVVGTAAPAHADEPGLFCTLTSRGTVSVTPSTASFGQWVTVQWNLQLGVCSGPVLYMTGRGFGGHGENLPLSGSRQVRAITEGSTLTWDLYLYDLATDNQSVAWMATRTITVL